MATRAQDVYESLSIFDKGLTVWTTTYTSTDVVALTDSLTRHWLPKLATSLYDSHLLKCGSCCKVQWMTRGAPTVLEWLHHSLMSITAGSIPGTIQPQRFKVLDIPFIEFFIESSDSRDHFSDLRASIPFKHTLNPILDSVTDKSQVIAKTLT